MGMFDTLLLRCPECGEEFEEQTKLGECMLARYPENAVPTSLALILDGWRVTCDKCGTASTLRTDVFAPKTIPMKLHKE
jgi:hypothetical protein